MSAPNPVSTFPVPDLTGQYRMGPLFQESPGVDFWWNTQLPDGSYTICEEPPGWESVDYITPIDQVGGRDGGLLGPPSVAPRYIEVDGLIVCPDAESLRDNLAALRRILGPQGIPGPRQPVIWEQHDFGSGIRLALITRPTGNFVPIVLPGHVPGGVAAKINFTLVAANPPWKYQSGSPSSAEVGLANPALITGRTYDKSYNWNYGVGTGSPGGEITVINEGSFPAYPLFTVTGEADFPIITNVTTGLEFAINRNLGTLEQVTINSRTGIVTPSSVRLVGRPFPLVVGPNTIRWRTTSGVFHPEALLHLDWRNTST